jgi:N-acetylneuraminate lyase
LKNQDFWIAGLVPAVFTPMHPDGSLNLAQVSPVVDQLITDGASALYVCGGTGEGLSLTTDERIQVADAYIDAAAGRIPVIVQVGHNSLVQAQGLAEHAQGAGADAISAVPPSFYKIDSLDVLLESLAMILRGAPDLPFYYYHIPRLTNFNLDVVEFLSKSVTRMPGLRGVKYSNFTIFEMQACVEFDDGRFNILFGSDEMLLSGLIGGAQGAVGSTYNFSTPLYRRIIDAYEHGDIDAARRWQSLSVEMVRRINRFEFPSHNFAALKAMMAVIGLDCGPTRLPQVSLEAEKIKSLKVEMEAIGFFEWGRKPLEGKRP